VVRVASLRPLARYGALPCGARERTSERNRFRSQGTVRLRPSTLSAGRRPPVRPRLGLRHTALGSSGMKNGMKAPASAIFSPHSIALRKTKSAPELHKVHDLRCRRRCALGVSPPSRAFGVALDRILHRGHALRATPAIIPQGGGGLPPRSSRGVLTCARGLGKISLSGHCLQN
jgi:hypothetical protein